MDLIDLLADLHRRQQRQGPGSANSTKQAMLLADLDNRVAANGHLSIADIGCGTGIASLTLAQAVPSQVTAVDILQPFLDTLQERAQAANLDQSINLHCGSMDALPFATESLDVIWSEGAIYNIGFATGIELWRPLLKPGGVLAVSEITWTTAERPQIIESYWQANYNQIATASEKISQLEAAGYKLLGYFPLPMTDWLAGYYEPLERSFEDFADRHNHDPAVLELIEQEQEEIALYRTYQHYYSYGFYIAEKI